MELFQECGSKELRFVVNSGLFLGTLLGILQMGVWLCWDPWWSLAVGGEGARVLRTSHPLCQLEVKLLTTRDVPGDL